MFFKNCSSATLLAILSSLGIPLTPLHLDALFRKHQRAYSLSRRWSHPLLLLGHINPDRTFTPMFDVKGKAPP